MPARSATWTSSAACTLALAGCHVVFGVDGDDGLVIDAPANGRLCFVDEFDGDAIDMERWALFATNTNVKIRQKDALEIEFEQNAIAQAYNALISARAYDFRAGLVMGELLVPPILHRQVAIRMAASNEEYFSLDVRYDSAAGPRLVAKIDNGSTPLIDRTFDPVNDRWFRIKLEGSRASFETSPNGLDGWVGRDTNLVKTPDGPMSVQLTGYTTMQTITSEPESLVKWDHVRVEANDCTQ